ncbi:MAG: helix-turn-helix transcriptional regulator [Lawsonibacter sp.]|jgi:two-component system response regulator YesN|nr:helix-turn-helix transcriptional regulator [Lawsonibacter sp.]
MKKLNLRRHFSWDSVFTKTFYGMLGLSVSVVLIFYLVLNSTLAQHQREQIAATNLNSLRLAASSVELTVDALSQGMTQIMWNSDFVGYMVVPTQQKQELHYRICQQLKNVVSSSRLLSRAYFYSPFNDLVFQNSDALLDRKTMADRELLQAFESMEWEDGFSSAKTRTHLFHYSGRLFLFQELNIATHIGTLAYELDIEEIQAGLLPSGENGSAVLVFDREGFPIFPPAEGEGKAVDWADMGSLITYQDLGTRDVWNVEGYYCYEGLAGWRFLMPLNAGTLTYPLSQLLLTYLPMFLLLILVGLVFALYISQVIYRPIDHLMRVVAPSAAVHQGAGGNEVDILEMIYSSAQKEYAQLQGIISGIAPEILESMLKNLLVGKHLTRERVEDILHGVGDPISARGRFCVLACQMVPQGRRIEDAEVNLYLLAIRKLVQRLSTPECPIYDVRTDVLTLGLICCFPEDRTLTQLSQELRQIQQSLRLHAEAMPFRLFCARGKFYPDLLDVRYSYHEAMERVQYQRYLHSTGENAPAPQDESLEGGGLVIDQALIQSRAKDIMEQAADNAAAQAESLMERVLEEFQRQARDEQELKRYLQMLQDQLTERVITYPLSQEDQRILSECSLISAGSRTFSAQEALEAIRQSAKALFRISASYSQKNRYKYVEQAKQYVDENYMDSNLSLNSVGDFVGISASYLSEIWSETSHEKFSVYLATLRVEKAQQLLTTTKLAIKEIGFRCGFNSVQNFIRVFKKYTGVPPGQFRENQRGQMG